MIRLVAPDAEHATRFEEMIAEYRANNDIGIYTGFYSAAWDGYHAYRILLERLSHGGWPFPEVVPGETHFIMDDEQIIGEVYLRFRLDSVLRKDGGNIGYQIRPNMRSKGYATAGLRLALKRLREVGVTEALLTCSDDNGASIRVIEKSGGVRIDDAHLDDGTKNRRYLIQTASGLRV